MKTTITSLLLLLFGAATLTSCEECGEMKINEPTGEDVKWLVYEKDDIARFLTEEKDTITYVRSVATVQNVPGEGYSASDECVEQLDTQVINIIEDVEKKQPYLGTSILSKTDTLLVRVGVGKLGAWEINKDKPTHQSLEVNGKTYASVFEVKPGNNTASPQPTDVKRILFNKEQGFLSIEFHNGKKLERIDQ
ncbi:hypothetical protein [Pontibacter ummariensis]|nr:hypothetical protein [Pontibacter ummariensis]